MSKAQQKPHLAIIDPGVRSPELDSFNRLVFMAPEFHVSYHMPALFGMSSLDLLTRKIDALVIFGSGASVYENLPWQQPMNDWLLKRIEEGCPVLGICYGHQLLAHLLGGHVDFATPDHVKYKGLRDISFQAGGFWGAAGSTGRMVVSHREVVTDLPTSCSVVASSSTVQVEAFAHKKLALWGIQSHPEAGPGFLANQDIQLAPESKPFHSGQGFMRAFLEHALGCHE